MRAFRLLPKNQYEFKSNSEYAKMWSFLPSVDWPKTLAQQLTYLEFHRWLFDNLQQRNPKLPDEEKHYSHLSLNVAEGFYRTDVLTYASLCEGALFCVIHSLKTAQGDACHKKVRNCFENRTVKFTRVSEKTFTTSDAKDVLLGYAETQIEPVYEPVFFRLVEAGYAVHIYGENLKARLHKLREHRNLVHLSTQQEAKKLYHIVSTQKDVDEAKQALEDLRYALEKFCSRKPNPFESVTKPV